MPEPLRIARNPDPHSSLPFLVRIPLGDGIVLRTKDTWPRTTKVYCYRHDQPWDDDVELVVEDRYSAVFKLGHVRPSLVADQLGECQVRWPSVPIIFAETRPLAEEWTYRFLAAAVQECRTDQEAVRLLPHDTNGAD